MGLNLYASMDRLESMLGSSLTNEHGVHVIEGSLMGVAARVDRVGVDRDGQYAIVTINGKQFQYKLNQIVEINHTPTPF